MSLEASFYDSIENCLQVIKKVYTSLKLCLQIEGYKTDGGLCYNLPTHQVYNSFLDKYDKVYCSETPPPILLSGVHRPNDKTDIQAKFIEGIMNLK